MKSVGLEFFARHSTAATTPRYAPVPIPPVMHHTPVPPAHYVHYIIRAYERSDSGRIKLAARHSLISVTPAYRSSPTHQIFGPLRSRSKNKYISDVQFQSISSISPIGILKQNRPTRIRISVDNF